MRIVKKLTTKDLGIEIGKSALIAGLVKSFEEVESQFGGLCVKFQGNFGAEVIGIDGLPEKIRSGILYVPEIMQNMLVGMVEEGLRVSGDAYNGTEFAFRLLKAPDEDTRNGRGYKWNVETIVEPTEAQDPVSRILLTYGKPEAPKAEDTAATEQKKDKKK